jgi:hypothetical protein
MATRNGCNIVARGLQAVKQKRPTLCHSERSEESLIPLSGANRREIPRFARNDKVKTFPQELEI